MEDEECAETNEESIFRFLFFKIWLFLYSKLVHFRLISHIVHLLLEKDHFSRVPFPIKSIHYIITKLLLFMVAKTEAFTAFIHEANICLAQ